MKRVIDNEEEPNEIVVTKCKSEHIYAISIRGYKGGIYKAQTVENDKWVFAYMSNSYNWWNGTFSSLENMLKRTLMDNYPIYQFENSKEFFEWALREIK